MAVFYTTGCQSDMADTILLLQSQTRGIYLDNRAFDGCDKNDCGFLAYQKICRIASNSVSDLAAVCDIS